MDPLFIYQRVSIYYIQKLYPHILYHYIRTHVCYILSPFLGPLPWPEIPGARHGAPTALRGRQRGSSQIGGGRGGAWPWDAGFGVECLQQH